MKNFKYAMLTIAALLASPQAFACFTVYNQANQIVYNAQTTPVDMRYQIHEVLPAVFPGGHMVFGNEPDCPVTSAVYVRAVGAAPITARSGSAAALPPKPSRN